MIDSIDKSSNANSRSKRIIKNTVMLFIRMFVLMVINLLAVRYVLSGLGELDYGIFNTVAGVVTMTSFISSVLALSTQRFFSIAIGEGDKVKMNDIFSASINIMLVITLILLVIFETLGVWFIETQLTIPEHRLNTAMWIYQFALFSFIFSLIQIPYMAAIFAHEDIGIYTIISTLECLGKFIIALLIGSFLADNLLFYGLGLLIIAIVVFSLYVFTGHFSYRECRYHKVISRKIHWELLNFSGWTTLGSVANTGMIQGGTILLNIFFGPIINVSFAIALQINNAFSALSNSLVIPFRPAMIKAYAEKNNDYVDQMFNICNKITFYILLLIGVPIIIEMRFILKLWLGNYNEDTVIFSRLMILYLIFIIMHNPITILMHANGHIKEYHLPVESITLLCLPVFWVVFKVGFPSYSIFFVMIGGAVIAHIIRLFCLKRFHSSFSIKSYMKSLVLPAVIISTIAVLAISAISNTTETGFFQFFFVSLASLLIIPTLVFYFGINSQERKLLTDFLHIKLKI